MMIADAYLVDRLIEFVAKQTGFPQDRLSGETTLAGDLGIAGDDAHAFFEAFITEFNLDRESFRQVQLKEHFGPEAPLPGWAWLAGLAFWLPPVFLGEIAGIPLWLTLLLLAFLSFGVAAEYRRSWAESARADERAIRLKHLLEAVRVKRWP
jgi:hypothetical protein